MNKIKDEKLYGIQGGYLIVFEGIDGSGKSTQIQLLAERLNKENFKTVIFHEPTKGKWGKKIRELVKHSRDCHDELRWFIEDRKEDIKLNIKPAMKNNMIVILHRYYYSNIVYQGTMGEIDPGYIMELNYFAPRPNLCFILDCDPNDAYNRIENSRKGKTDYFEKIDNLHRVREMYLEFFKDYSEIKIIPQLKNPENIHEQIWDIVREEIGKLRKIEL
ncbi:MAG: dTMP kinase [Promethearchaeota archaeon]